MTALMSPRHKNGLTIQPVTYGGTVNVSTTMPNNTDKLSLSGQVCFEFHQDSYKFSPEAIVNVWSREPSVIEHNRITPGYFRTELNIPLEDFYMMCCEFKFKYEKYARSK